MKLFITLCAVIGIAGSAMAQDFNGYALYANQNQSTGYLIDGDGDIAKTWNLPSSANYACALDDNGNFVYGAVNQGNSLNGAAVGGKVVSINASNSINWQYVYSNSQHVSHHDICLMPNGNVLLIAWEVKTASQLTQHGYANATTSKWPDHIVEVQQNGTGGEIVWEWHMWDHMVQDHDPAKDNYGVVADHPELLDINVPVSVSGPPGPGGGGGDWFHTNGIDYNPDLDQIVFSSRYLNEIFVIDHSTTTAEAAGHTGGNAGKGGDFLYRWGHPSNYDASGLQVIPAAVHDVRWVKTGRPYAGYIQIFNNEGSNGHSTVDAFNPPLNGYNYDLTPGQAYAPSTYDLRHLCEEDSDGQSSSDRMSNGNIFVNVADEYMYEVDAQGNMVWQYAAGPKKAFRYECDHPGIIELVGLDPSCSVTVIENAEAENVALYPNPSTGVFNISGIPADESVSSIEVYNMLGSLVLTASRSNTIDLSNAGNGFYFIAIVFESGDRITRKVSVQH